MAKAAKTPVARSVESLKTLLAQINKLAPNRDKKSDGWIGDVKHMSRHSDHNAEPDGTVDARDFTNDPNGGCDARKVCQSILDSRDPRLSYVICNGEIASGRKGPKPWQWRKYTGANGHYHHFHISVLDEGQDDTTPWKIEKAFGKAATLTPKEVSSVLKRGSKGQYVEDLQRNLVALGYALKVDGDFGAATEMAVRGFQSSNGLVIDGWAGTRTVAKIAELLEAKKLKPKIVEAEKKADIATKVVEATAEDGKISTSEVVTAVTGVSGAAAAGKTIVDSVNETTQSVGSIVTTLGPWVLLGVVIIAGAVYIYYDRRKRRLEAVRASQALSD